MNDINTNEEMLKNIHTDLSASHESIVPCDIDEMYTYANMVSNDTIDTSEEAFKDVIKLVAGKSIQVVKSVIKRVKVNISNFYKRTTTIIKTFNGNVKGIRPFINSGETYDMSELSNDNEKGLSVYIHTGSGISIPENLLDNYTYLYYTLIKQINDNVGSNFKLFGKGGIHLSKIQENILTYIKSGELISDGKNIDTSNINGVYIPYSITNDKVKVMLISKDNIHSIIKLNFQLKKNVINNIKLSYIDGSELIDAIDNLDIYTKQSGELSKIYDIVLYIPTILESLDGDKLNFEDSSQIRRLIVDLEDVLGVGMDMIHWIERNSSYISTISKQINTKKE